MKSYMFDLLFKHNLELKIEPLVIPANTVMITLTRGEFHLKKMLNYAEMADGITFENTLFPIMVDEFNDLYYGMDELIEGNY